MSRSRRKSPIRGITSSESEKNDKRIYNRRFRRAQKQVLTANTESELSVLRNYSNPWLMNKDGKARFDSTKFPKLMRK
ncbi:MAG: hypothetical protein WBD16_02910 [Pyrinomonadaceae bacterium]